MSDKSLFISHNNEGPRTEDRQNVERISAFRNVIFPHFSALRHLAGDVDSAVPFPENERGRENPAPSSDLVAAYQLAWRRRKAGISIRSCSGSLS